MLSEAGFEIRSILNLHAKVVLADGTWGIVGSGNLTTAGLSGTKRKNLELGVTLTKRQSVTAETIIENWWRKAKPVDEAQLAKFESIAASARGRGSRKGYGSFVYGDEPAAPTTAPPQHRPVDEDALSPHPQRPQGLAAKSHLGERRQTATLV